ncbi:hypothetical protein C8R45DRAFT_477614 [Mycena sanguinolenta]|nr:hypothetical protein C8R45DRAFT_477614 [Mycena sanguinolenta]
MPSSWTDDHASSSTTPVAPRRLGAAAAYRADPSPLGRRLDVARARTGCRCEEDEGGEGCEDDDDDDEEDNQRVWDHASTPAPRAHARLRALLVRASAARRRTPARHAHPQAPVAFYTGTRPRPCDGRRGEGSTERKRGGMRGRGSAYSGLGSAAGVGVGNERERDGKDKEKENEWKGVGVVRNPKRLSEGGEAYEFEADNGGRRGQRVVIHACMHWCALYSNE